MRNLQPPNSIKSLLASAITSLSRTSPTPYLDAEILLSFVLKKERFFLYSHPEYLLTKKTKSKFFSLVKRRCCSEPIAYITNNKEFYGLPFYVDKNVLIPRPDTELIIEKIIKFAARQETRSHNINMNPSLRTRARLIIIDIGTGSGCIAITLKKYLPQCKIIATDISQIILKVAKKNAKKLLNHENTKINFICSDLFNNVPKKYLGKIDIIAANLPYLPKNVALKKSLKYEPNIALQDRQYLSKFLLQAKQYLSPQGKIFLEMSKRQINLVKKTKLNCDYLAF